MLKNKKFVKFAVSMLLSVTLVCAMCLQVYAAWPKYIDENNTAHNMYYSAGVDRSANGGVVYAVCGKTFVCPIDYTLEIPYPKIVVRTVIQMFKDSVMIYNESTAEFIDLEADYYLDPVDTPWIVPDATDPFDYIITYHEVYAAESYAAWVADQSLPESARQCPLTWSQTRVFGYNDLLVE